MTTRSNILAWKNPWSQEPSGLPSLWDRKELDMAKYAPRYGKSNFIVVFIRRENFGQMRNAEIIWTGEEAL